MRPFRFAIHLKECGWTPTVLTIATKGQALTEKEARLLDDVEIVEVEPPFDRTVKSESQLGLADKRKTASTRSLSSDVLSLLDRQIPVDTWLLLFWLKYGQLLETIERVQPHVLWSTGDPWSGLVIGGQLARRTGLPWVADFRDPWTLCQVRTAGKSGLTQAIDRYFERRVVETADTVLFQSRQNEEKYRRYYADLDLHTTTIYNSFDPVVFEDPVDLSGTAEVSGTGGDTLDLGFFGRFRAMSPASLIADVLAAARRRHGDLADGLRVFSFGPLNEADARYAREQGVLSHFHRRDAVPLERALSALRRFDLLLLSTDPRRDEIIPAKLLEYLAAGRPILSLSRNPEVRAILQRTSTGLQPHPDDPDRLADLLVESLQAKRAGTALPIPFDPDPSEVQRFEARRTTQELAALFDATVERARRD
jgi:glycosyltransferase involved in cell wall biosynthesis